MICCARAFSVSMRAPHRCRIHTDFTFWFAFTNHKKIYPLNIEDFKFGLNLAADGIAAGLTVDHRVLKVFKLGLDFESDPAADRAKAHLAVDYKIFTDSNFALGFKSHDMYHEHLIWSAHLLSVTNSWLEIIRRKLGIVSIVANDQCVLDLGG